MLRERELSASWVAVRRHARSPVAAGLAGKVAEGVTLLLLVSVVPRTLGPESYGVFTLALAIVTIGSASLALGGPSLMSRFIPAAAVDERPALARALALRALRWRLLQLGMFVVVAAIVVGVDPDRFPPLQAALVVVALACDVGATLAFQIGLGLGRTSAWSFRYPLQQGVTVVAAVALGSAFGSTGAVAAIAIGAGVALLVGSLRLHELRGASPIELPTGVTRFALLNGVGGVLVQVVHRAGVIAVIVLTGSSRETGFAGLAAGVGLAATYLVWQLFTVELPRLAAQAGEDPVGADAAARAFTERLTWALVPLTLVAVPMVDRLIPLAAGEHFRDALPAIGVALALLPIAPLTALGNQAAALRLRPEVRAKSGGAGVIVFVAVALVLVPLYGAVGATIALLAGSGALTAALVVAFPGLFSPRLLTMAAFGVAATLALAALT